MYIRKMFCICFFVFIFFISHFHVLNLLLPKYENPGRAQPDLLISCGTKYWNTYVYMYSWLVLIVYVLGLFVVYVRNWENPGRAQPDFLISCGIRYWRAYVYMKNVCCFCLHVLLYFPFPIFMFSLFLFCIAEIRKSGASATRCSYFVWHKILKSICIYM